MNKIGLSRNLVGISKKISKSKEKAQSQQASAKLGEMFEELNFRRREIEFKPGSIVERRVNEQVQN
ncbi:MAG: hypothetical protein WCR53_04335 [Bacteroidaceae bacterium]|jgi:hypothetical protein